MYTNFYSNLPEENLEEKNKKNKNMSVYMNSLQNFTREILMNSDSLMSDINYLENKLHNMKTGLENMMFFYNLEEKYDKLKIQLEVIDNEDIKKEYETLQNYSTDYDIYEKNIKKYSYDLYKFNNFFAEQIKNIHSNEYLDQKSDAMDKFDKVLMLSVRLIELKVDLEKCLENLKENFENLKKLGIDLENTLLNLGEVVEKKVIEVEKEKIAKDKGVPLVLDAGVGAFKGVLLVLLLMI